MKTFKQQVEEEVGLQKRIIAFKQSLGDSITEIIGIKPCEITWISFVEQLGPDYEIYKNGERWEVATQNGSLNVLDKEEVDKFLTALKSKVAEFEVIDSVE